MIDLIIETKQRKVYDIKARDESGVDCYGLDSESIINNLLIEQKRGGLC